MCSFTGGFVFCSSAWCCGVLGKCRDVSRVRHCVLGRTHSSFGRREYWMKGPIGRRKKKSRMFKQITKSRKKQRHTMPKFVFCENIFYQLVDSSVTVYFAVNFQTKAEKPLCFLITPQSLVLSFVCYVWISTCCVTLSELLLGGTNRRHCRSANNNLPFQSILSFFACCPSEFQALVSLW